MTSLRCAARVAPCNICAKCARMGRTKKLHTAVGRVHVTCNCDGARVNFMPTRVVPPGLPLRKLAVISLMCSFQAESELCRDLKTPRLHHALSAKSIVIRRAFSIRVRAPTPTFHFTYEP